MKETLASAFVALGLVLSAQSPSFSSDFSKPVLLSQNQRVFCAVSRIRTGQLSVRFEPGGSSRAGLNNGDTVKWLYSQGNWAYIRIVDGPNRQLNGVEGWVNSDYLDCWTQ